MSSVDRPVLRTEGLAKHFGRLAAVDGVDLLIARQEIVGLIGPNGSGKTTFLNLLSGLLAPTAGSIELEGQSLVGLKPYQRAERGLARTFQVVRPLPRLSVLDNVVAAAAFGRVDGRGTLHEAYDEAVRVLKAVGLGDRLQSATSALPVQELKRLELARAMATRPVMLLLDEVLASIDAVDAKGLLELLLQQREVGLTILMIEHRVDMLLSVADRVVVMDQGRVIANGRPREVTAHPEVIQAYLGHRYARRFEEQARGVQHAARE